MWVSAIDGDMSPTMAGKINHSSIDKATAAVAIATIQHDSLQASMVSKCALLTEG